MKIDSKEIEALISSSGEKRYTYFVKRAADAEKVWGLYNDGWALASTDEGDSVFPVWPAREYAALCTKGMWSSFEPRSISLEDFLNELLPNLKSDGVAPGVFCTPEKDAVMPSVEQLIEDVKFELTKYDY